MWPAFARPIPSPPVRHVLLSSLCWLSSVAAFSFQSAPSPNVDLSQLGSVVLAGDYDSVSLYNYVGQDEDGLSNNGSQQILAQYPNGGFAPIGTSDAAITSMCPFVTNGKLNGIIITGNFTSLAGQRASAAAMYNPTDGSVTPLPGLTGTVSDVLCDTAMNVVYFAGDFTGGNSTNAIVWTDQWTNLPFAGFNGPVSALAQLPNGHIVYGGQFTGVGNNTASVSSTAQIVSLQSGNITSGPDSTTNTAYNDPANIICRTNADSSNGWLLADNQPGYWEASLGFQFTPSKLRLYNIDYNGYGTKTWRYNFYPQNGIANFTYTAADGSQQSCSSECPLTPGNNTESSYMDFYFVNPLQMTGFGINISAWYGNGGGLGGIELFRNDTVSYAINNFNEPYCDSVSSGANSSVTGAWTVSYHDQNPNQYLSAYMLGGTVDHSNTASVTFTPDIKQSGNYSILLYTPGCLADNTCSSRGEVNVTGFASNPSGSHPTAPIATQLAQTNNYDKYDVVYYGYVDANSPSFNPTVTVTPTQGQKGPLTVVASRVGFDLRNSTSGGLNALFEYDPSLATVGNDFSQSTVDVAGTQLNTDASVLALAVVGGNLYAAGDFTGPQFHNVFVLENGNATSLSNGGLNMAVQTMYNNGSLLYMGGNFTNTVDNSNAALANVAYYDTAAKSWHAMGAGVNGQVNSIVPLTVNISSTQMVDAIAVSGFFGSVNGFGTYAPISVENIAVWIPSMNNWLDNVDSSPIALIGRINAFTTVPNGPSLWAGSVDSQTLQATGATGLTSNGAFGLQQLPLTIQPQNSTGAVLAKRAISQQQTVAGVVTGLFYNENGLNLTIFGGHFSAKLTNGSMASNLAIVNGSNSEQVTGFVNQTGSNEAVLALETSGTTLFAGGSMPGGYIAYNLATNTIPAQPQPLTGGSGIVEAIAARPSASTVFFGGNFTNAGSLSCSALCIYDTSAQRWNPPPPGLSADSQINRLSWIDSNRLIMAGNMTVGGSSTTFAQLDASSNTYSVFEGAGDPNSVPGPITAFSAGDSNYDSYFAAGIATNNGSAFIAKFTSGSSGPNGQIAGSWATAESGAFGAATVIESVQALAAANSHSGSSIVDSDYVVLVTGLLQMPGYGNVSAAIYNGTSFQPFVLTTMRDGSPGSVRQAFVQNPGNLLLAKCEHIYP